jgi:hypothetical protein
VTFVVTATTKGAANMKTTMTGHESFDARVLRWGGWVMGAFLTTALALAGSARAQEPGPGPHREGRRREPPPAAFEACKDKKVEDACQVTFPGHHGQQAPRTIEGKCHDTADGRLFCRPAKPPGPPPAPPPGEDRPS